MRVAVGGIMQETNTFSPLETDLEDFRANELSYGTEMLKRFRGASTEISGFDSAARSASVELVPILATRATSSGRLNRETFDFLKSKLLEGLRQAGPLDGVLLALHGSMSAEELDDAEGDLLAAVRDLVGENIPLVASLDMHANITQLMVRSSNALVGYRTHPHVDLYDTGRRAAQILFSIARNEIRPTMAFCNVPMITYPERMHTIEGPVAEVVARAREIEEEGGVLSVSTFIVQPWLDVAELGCTMVVITDDDAALAQTFANELGEMLWERRHLFHLELVPLPDAIDRALQVDGPVIFSYSGDNISGGSPGDSTLVLQALVERKVKQPSFLTMVDPQAVARLTESGIGSEVTLEVGGKIDQTYSQPVKVTGTVRLISDGRFTFKGPAYYTGMTANMGRTVVLQIEGISLVLCERAVSTFDPELYRSLGLEPTDAKIVVVREAAAFKAGYEHIMVEALQLDTPGFSASDVRTLPFRRAPRPLFPLNPDFSWVAG